MQEMIKDIKKGLINCKANYFTIDWNGKRFIINRCLGFTELRYKVQTLKINEEEFIYNMNLKECEKMLKPLFKPKDKYIMKVLAPTINTLSTQIIIEKATKPINLQSNWVLKKFSSWENVLEEVGCIPEKKAESEHVIVINKTDNPIYIYPENERMHFVNMNE